MSESKELQQDEQAIVMRPLVAKKTKSPMRELIESIVIVIALVISVNYFIVQGFYIPSESMVETLHVGDRILVNKLLLRVADPHHGDIVVFKFPPDPTRIFVKRVIGEPGDTVELKEGFIYVNGKKQIEPYIKEDMQGEFGPEKVPADKYFVMGDNRNNSDDSRYWGMLPERIFLGKPL